MITDNIIYLTISIITIETMFHFRYWVLSILAILFAMNYFGQLDKISFFANFKRKVYDDTQSIRNLIDRISAMVDAIEPAGLNIAEIIGAFTGNSMGSNSIEKTNKTVLISVGSDRFMIPYSIGVSAKMVSRKVYLVKGEDKIDITQTPGTSYFFSGKQLGGKIIAENMENQKTFDYGAEIIPGLLKELDDSHDDLD